MDPKVRNKFCKKHHKKIKIALGIFVAIFVIYQVLAYKSKPEEIKYGVSYNVPYVLELGLDWQETYLATMDDLGADRIRIAAHWTLTEPEQDKYDFTYLDFQVKEASKRKVDLIIGVGRRLPRWPECHIPEWVDNLSEEEYQEELLEYIEEVVVRYRGYENVKLWQVENEPFLEVFAYEFCGDLDKELLDREIALVKELDSDRDIMMTDSGNLGRWTEAYSRTDVFGTSVYLYFWNPYIGKFRSVLPASFYRVKDNMMSLIHGDRHSIISELSLEPWLIQPLVKTPVETQFEMMDLDRIKKVLEYGEKTRFETQYLWGVEWWYWLKEEHDMPEIWDFMKDVI